ncbi:MAG: stage II sporulation protein M [Peptococcaceae bacterium]|jgi:stage II sporulation protein M|nr:stage II sporulation protein M [Peptococcaceae bacterium]MDR2736271.1 stage II sporulation protein M [Gracilibacteraceae bacterium]
MRQKFIRYLRANWLIHLTLGCAFLVGVSLGALGVHYLSDNTVVDLNRFVGSLLEEQPGSVDLSFSYQLLRDNLIMMLLIWVLGLTVVGIPLIYLIVGIRGAVFGFSVCFIIISKGLAGLGFVLLAILLPSVIFFVCLLLASGLATRFSFSLLRSRASGKPLWSYFSQYSLLFMLTTAGLAASGYVQVVCTALGIGLIR